METPANNFDYLKTTDLKTQLEEAGIDISLWGKGESKTFEHLQKEIEEGETNLVKNEQGELLRKVVVGIADIYFLTDEGKKLHLKEEKQVFRDGRSRVRDLGGSVFEKMKPDEDPEEAVCRGVQEELGLSGPVALVKKATQEQLVDSPSYPGLKSQYVRHIFETFINKEQFKPEGYVEEQKDKSTYFVWEEIEK